MKGVCGLDSTLSEAKGRRYGVKNYGKRRRRKMGKKREEGEERGVEGREKARNGKGKRRGGERNTRRERI